MAWMRFNSNTHIRSAGMQVSFDVLYPEHGVGAKGGRTLYLLHDYGETGQSGYCRAACRNSWRSTP